MTVQNLGRVSMAMLMGLAILAGSVSSAEAVRRKVIEGTAIGAGVGGILGLIVGGPRGGLAGAAVGGAAGAIITSSQPDCYWRTNSRGRHYKVCY